MVVGDAVIDEDAAADDEMEEEGTEEDDRVESNFAEADVEADEADGSGGGGFFKALQEDEFAEL